MGYENRRHIGRQQTTRVQSLTDRATSSTMHGSAQEIHEFYGQHSRAWGKYLGAITRKLSRRLDQSDVKYDLKHRIKTADSLLEKQARRASGRRADVAKSLSTE